ncbi:hypothetical protein H5410_018287 [Solanum commersonii]|uniref:Uncharacterized protein n=1 Tax=Solanum commersonii TaxID=4109 RepID=A0A9J6A2X6_SOLCO|nr:hypothetical protein H5410_018287 [Solanum commersonii]
MVWTCEEEMRRRTYEKVQQFGYKGYEKRQSLFFVPESVALKLRVFRKQPLYLHEVVIRSAYILSSQTSLVRFH